MTGEEKEFQGEDAQGPPGARRQSQRRWSCSVLKDARWEDKRQETWVASWEILSAYKKNIFTIRRMKDWDRLLREVVESPSLEMIQDLLGLTGPQIT